MARYLILNRKSIFTPFLLLALMPSIGLADTSTRLAASDFDDLLLFYEEEDLITIATGIKQSLSQAPSIASVITAEDIKASGAFTIGEVLEMVPGLHVIPSTLNRLKPSYVFRGLYSGQGPQVLIMWNGTRISHGIQGSLSSSVNLNVSQISHIEVIRGPGSAIYGADAYAGVINIVTKSAKEIDGFHSGVRAGSFDSQNIWLQYGGQLNNEWDLSMGLEYMKQGPDKSRKVEQKSVSVPGFSYTAESPDYLDTRYEETTLDLALQNNNWKLGLFTSIHQDRGIGAGITQVIDHEGYSDGFISLLSIEYQKEALLPDLTFNGKLSYFYSETDDHFVNFPKGTQWNGDTYEDGLLGNPAGSYTVPQLDLTFQYTGFSNHHIRLNFGIKEESNTVWQTKNFNHGGTPGELLRVSGTQYVFLSDNDRTVKYLSLQEIWTITDTWQLTAGVRYDKYSDFGDTINPRGALVWNIHPTLTSKLLYGRAYRAPAFGEQYMMNNRVSLGNPDLNPEVIDTYELAFDYRPIEQLKTHLGLYTFEAKDMIGYKDDDGLPGGTSHAQNMTKIKGSGYELEADWKINSAWRIRSNYAWQHTENSDTNKRTPYVPKQQFYFSADWRFEQDWLLSTQLNLIVDRARAEGDQRENIDDYTLINMTLRRSNLSKNWEVAATIKNLFDNDAREPSNGVIPNDYPLNERSAFIEIRYHLPAD
jgi:outer membrane receptor for ferrienterochelin and colicins